MSDEALKALVKSLYGIVDNTEEATQLLEMASSVDLEKEWRSVSDEYKRHCVNCGRPYMVPRTNSPEEGFCPRCESDSFKTELMRVQKQNRRAAREGKPGTLTFREWMQTLKHFDHKCAYCRKAEYTDMEHFVPLKKSADHIGTTADNVVPSCSACNFYKKSKNPLNRSSRRYIRIPDEDLTRVQNYLRTRNSRTTHPD